MSRSTWDHVTTGDSERREPYSTYMEVEATIATWAYILGTSATVSFHHLLGYSPSLKLEFSVCSYFLSPINITSALS